VAELSNSAVRRDLARLEDSLRLESLRLDHLATLGGRDAEAVQQIPATAAIVEALDGQLAERSRDAERLRLKATADGVLLGVSHELPCDSRPAARLRRWSGSLLETRNRGARVKPGTLVGMIASKAVDALLYVEDTDVDWVEPGQRVRLALAQHRESILEGEVVEVARRQTNTVVSENDLPLARLFENRLPVDPGRAYYQVRVRIEDPPSRLLAATRGVAKISVGQITWAQRLARTCARIFRYPR
jgi:hypothetical protein